MAAAALVLAGCTSTDRPTFADDDLGEAPLPTIGLDSELGSLSGGTDIRRIDTGEVTTLVMLGDSITVGAQPFLETNFDSLGFERVDVVAQELKRTSVTFGDNASGVDLAAFLATDVGVEPGERMWVVALGTNDISQYPSSDDARIAIEELLNEVPDDDPLLWINTYFEGRPDDTAEVNTAIEQAVAARGNATIARWDQLAPTPGVLRSAGVHPHSDGAEVFATFVAAAGADFLQR